MSLFDYAIKSTKLLSTYICNALWPQQNQNQDNDAHGNNEGAPAETTPEQTEVHDQEMIEDDDHNNLEAIDTQPITGKYLINLYKCILNELHEKLSATEPVENEINSLLTEFENLITLTYNIEISPALDEEDIIEIQNIAEQFEALNNSLMESDDESSSCNDSDEEHYSFADPIKEDSEIKEPYVGVETLTPATTLPTTIVPPLQQNTITTTEYGTAHPDTPRPTVNPYVNNNPQGPTQNVDNWEDYQYDQAPHETYTTTYDGTNTEAYNTIQENDEDLEMYNWGDYQYDQAPHKTGTETIDYDAL